MGTPDKAYTTAELIDALYHLGFADRLQPGHVTQFLDAEVLQARGAYLPPKARRSFSLDDLIMAAWYQEMKKRKIMNAILMPAVTELLRYKLSECAKTTYVTSSEKYAIVYDATKQTPVSVGGEFHWSFCIGLLAERVRGAVSERERKGKTRQAA